MLENLVFFFCGYKTPTVGTIISEFLALIGQACRWFRGVERSVMVGRVIFLSVSKAPVMCLFMPFTLLLTSASFRNRQLTQLYIFQWFSIFLRPPCRLKHIPILVITDTTHRIGPIVHASYPRAAPNRQVTPRVVEFDEHGMRKVHTPALASLENMLCQ